MSTSDTETAFSHAAAFERIQEGFGWNSDLPEKILSENYASEVEMLLCMVVRSDSEGAVLVRGIKDILDHHESVIREAILEEGKGGGFYEEASILGSLFERLQQRYLNHTDGREISFDEAEAVVEQVTCYKKEVLSVVEERITGMFTHASAAEKVSWYQQR